MELSQSERARLVVRWAASQRGVNQKDIGEMVGYPNNTYFSNLLSGRKPISATLLEKIAALDPRINIDFLTGVSDDMLIGDEQPALPESPPIASPAAPSRVGIYVPAELVQMMSDLAATAREQQATIHTLVNALTNK